MATIKGIDGLTVGDVQEQLRQGGRFVVFGYCMSFLVITLRRSSDITFLRAGQSAFAAGLPYTVLSLVLGWWGFPWGLVYTPMVVFQNLGGGTDVTPQVMAQLGGGHLSQGIPPDR